MPFEPTPQIVGVITPYMRPANATLTFQSVPTGVLEVDSVGNEYEVMGETTISVALKVEGKDELVNQTPGANLNTYFYKGRCVEPRVVSSLKIGDRAQCVITDPASGDTQKGEFTILSVHQNAFAAITTTLGTRFEGTFQSVGGT